VGGDVVDRRSTDRLGLPDVVQLLRADIAQVRADLQEDIKDSEVRVSGKIDDAQSAFLAYQADHVNVHNRRAEDTDRQMAEMSKKIDAMTIVEAKRAGAIAVTLLIIRSVGQHWQALAVLAALVGVLLGKVDIDISGPLP
jgi:hypothetical protein